MVVHRAKVFIVIKSNSSFSPLSVTLLVSSLTSLHLVLDPEDFLLLFFFFFVLGHALRLTDLKSLHQGWNPSHSSENAES